MNSQKIRRVVSAVLLGGYFATGVSPAATACSEHTAIFSTAIKSGVVLASSTEMPSATAVDAALRDLWVGHAFAVRNVVMATIGGNKEAAAAAEAGVVANATAIAAAIEPFYGAAAKDTLFKLLVGHYGGIKGFLDASVSKDQAKQNKAMEDILANADAIATFLSGANPNLPKDAVMGLLQAHAGHHVTQIQQLIAGDYKDELQNWNDMVAHMNQIADALAGAIAKQFPEKFKA